MLSQMVVLLVLAVPAQPPAILLDGTHQLLLDDSIVAKRENVTRTIHPAVKDARNPVLWPTETWEGNLAIVYGSILRDGGKYRMWYHGGSGVGYAESTDGVTWTKPLFEFYPADGHGTNIVISREAKEGDPNYLPFYYELFGVHKDERAKDPNQRYVMGYLSMDQNYAGPGGDPFHPGQRRGLGVATSPDGIHWALAESWATEAICDGGTYWMLDPARARYVLYGRTKFIAPEVRAAGSGDQWVQQHFWGRSVARVESPDFRHWDFTKPATAPVVMTSDVKDAPGDEIYSMQVFPYESIYLGLVQVFHNQADACTLDIQLAVSHDGVEFTRVGDRTPFIALGSVGGWDRFNTSVANNPPLVEGDQLRFYYGGRTYRHSPYQGLDKGVSGGGIGFASISRDRFVSLDASFDGGAVETVPMRLGGNQLHLNAASRFGEILVEALDPKSGQVIALSRPVRKDGLDIPVAWDQGALPGPGHSCRFRLSLKNARLYSIWCTSGGSNRE